MVKIREVANASINIKHAGAVNGKTPRPTRNGVAKWSDKSNAVISIRAKRTIMATAKSMQPKIETVVRISSSCLSTWGFLDNPGDRINAPK